MKNTPILAKSAATLWVIFGSLIFIASILPNIMSDKKQLNLILLLAFTILPITVIPGIMILFNKSKGTVLPSLVVGLPQALMIFMSVNKTNSPLNLGVTLIFTALFISSILALSENKKYIECKLKNSR